MYKRSRLHIYMSQIYIIDQQTSHYFIKIYNTHEYDVYTLNSYITIIPKEHRTNQNIKH